jgi:hypothetical protein
MPSKIKIISKYIRIELFLTHHPMNLVLHNNKEHPIVEHLELEFEPKKWL